ncbi:Ulp1 protease family, C-terminal catalytic domain [Sesbania bispinosa]|nr:Ulp1 protease family, C-terminal catalytic domain [Sesbania bispinosa]
MAGNRKGFRRKDPPRPTRRSPRIEELNVAEKKNPKHEAIIEISSSLQASEPQAGEKTEPLSQFSSPTEDRTKEQTSAKRVKGLNEEYGEHAEKDQLRDLVKCLASIIVNGNNFTQSQIAAGLPLLLTTCLTPKNSSVQRNIDADSILASLSNTSERFTKSAPSMATGTSHGPQHLHDLNLVRNLFTEMDERDNGDHYINKKPIPSFNNDPIKRGLKIPFWMQLSFKPPIDMDLDDLEIVTAAYIFHIDLAGGSNGDEVLIRCKWGVGDRKSLRTLIPATWIDQEVLNLLASKLTHFESKIATNNSAWFLPTTFAQYALTWDITPETMIKRYKHKFMGKVDYLRKIFVPINDQNSHWYLMIIDLNQNKIVILDSLMCEWRNGWRKRHVKKLAIFIEEMLLDPSFYESSRTVKPIISDFEIYQPPGLPQQLNGYDCGVWVAKLMSDYVWDDDYNSISVTHTTRMKMALDLVLNSYNEVKYNFIRLACAKWMHFHEERKKLVKI